MVSKPANFVKRLTSRGLLAAAAASVVTALACVHNDGSVFIGGVLAPPVPVQGSACTYTASSTGPFLFQGTLDVGLASQYSPVVLVGNQLIARGDQTQVRVETSRFIIQGVIVRLTDAAGAEITSYTVQVAGQVEPAAGATPSYGSTVVTLVPPETVKLLRGALTVRGPSKRHAAASDGLAKPGRMGRVALRGGRGARSRGAAARSGGSRRREQACTTSGPRDRGSVGGRLSRT